MKNIFISFALILLLFSCTKTEDPKAALIIPTAYSSANFAANTVSELALKTQLTALTNEMKKAEIGTKLTQDAVFAIFSAGNPSVKSITGASYISKLEGSSGYFAELVASSGNTYDPTKPNVTGGLYGARLLNSGGVETLQVIEKGLFGAAFYNNATALMTGTITEATIDRIIGIYGASPSFPNTNTATITTSPDSYAALYASRRDKNDGNGIYSKIKNAFITAQAAVKAGSKYNNERDAAFAVIKLEWEKALISTVAHYGYAAITKLSSTNPAITVYSGALHDLGEGIGFLNGFKAVPQNQRKITDAQIDEYIKIISLDNAGKAEMFKYVTDPVGSITKLQTVFSKIQAVYGFTNSEMIDFKENWISKQGR